MVKHFLYLPLLVAGLASCGPIEYINQVTVKASRAVAEARAADAEELSPYEYWSAVTYLQMAKETVAYADFEMAIEYGDKAEEMARDARKLASQKREAGVGPSTPPMGTTTNSTEDEAPPDLSYEPPAPSSPDNGNNQ